MASNGRGRTRNYATIVYPESAPADWMSILADSCIPSFVSPLHDKDILPDGTLKKPHYHVMLMYDSVKTLEQAQEMFSKIGGVGNEIVQSIRGYARYLSHLDNPEKAQYSPEDVKSYGGADYISCVNLITDKYKAIGEIMDFVQVNDVSCFSDLAYWCRDNRPDWFRVLVDSGSHFIKDIMKSKTWKQKEDELMKRREELNRDREDQGGTEDS